LVGGPCWWEAWDPPLNPALLRRYRV